MSTAPSYAERIRGKIEAALSPSHLAVIDESHRHAGHAGAKAAATRGPAGHVGETHFRLEIVAEAFRGKSRLERQRLVNGLLREELDERVHALSLKTLAPEEWSPAA